MGKLILTLAAFAFLFSPSKAQACPFPFNEIGSQCLLFDTGESGSYYDMRLYCSRAGEGGRLAHIPSASQLAEIIKFINDYGLDHANYWIDASDEDYEGHWRWSDGFYVPMGAPFWRYDCDAALTLRPASDTNRNCAILDNEAHYLMADTSCLGDIGELKYSPICEIP